MQQGGENGWSFPGLLEFGRALKFKVLRIC